MVTKLSQRDYDAVMAMLRRPSVHNEALSRAAKAYRDWYRGTDSGKRAYKASGIGEVLRD